MRIPFRLSLPLLLLAIPALAAPPVKPAAGTVDANKTLVRRYIDDVLTANKQDELDQLLSSDFTDSTPGAEAEGTGPDVVRAAQDRIHTIFPTVQYRIDDLIAEGDKVVARYTVRARSKEAEGAPAKSVEVTGITIFRVAEGKIREEWIINDQVELYRQLGFTIQPPEPGAPEGEPAQPSPTPPAPPSPTL